MESGIILRRSFSENYGISDDKINRMTVRKDEKPFIIYPENKFKGIWDLFMTVVLIITCVSTPLSIAFED
jgi:hypothetical protein